MINAELSEVSPLCYGVPQGSILEPVLFTLYSQPFSNIISHGLQHQKYADDTDISSSSKPDNFKNAIDALVEYCAKS